MLVVKVELHSAVTHQVTEIARANISNISPGCEVADYSVDCFEYGGTHKGHRTGTLKGYRRWSTPVLQLIAKAILAAIPEEKKKQK